MSEKPKFDTVCLSGGGIKGFSFLGALDYLELNSYIKLETIKNWVGTSAGAIISFMFTLVYTTYELGNFILNFNFKKLEPEVDIENLLEFNGIDNGSKLILIITGFLKEKLKLDDITFQEHFNITKKKLTIIGTNFSKGEEVSFNYENTPDMSVLKAIRISTSIPIIFTPVLHNSDYYIDGGLINNFPIKYCNPNTTLGIFIRNSNCNKLNNIMTLINGCIAIASDTISKKDNYDKYPYIIEIQNYFQEFTNFNLDTEKKLKIINLGQTFAKKFLENKINLKFLNKKNQTDSLYQNEIACQTETNYIDQIIQTDEFIIH